MEQSMPGLSFHFAIDFQRPDWLADWFGWWVWWASCTQANLGWPYASPKTLPNRQGRWWNGNSTSELIFSTKQICVNAPRAWGLQTFYSPLITPLWERHCVEKQWKANGCHCKEHFYQGCMLNQMIVWESDPGLVTATLPHHVPSVCKHDVVLEKSLAFLPSKHVSRLRCLEEFLWWLNNMRAIEHVLKLNLMHSYQLPAVPHKAALKRSVAVAMPVWRAGFTSLSSRFLARVAYAEVVSCSWEPCDHVLGMGRTPSSFLAGPYF